MFQIIKCGIVTITIACSAGTAIAQSFNMTPLPDDPSVQPEIIGGRKSRPADWPATFAFSNCTSTAIGPRVLLTAAHCVRDGAKGTLEAAGKKVNVECAHHPTYTPSTTASGNKTTSTDWALCIATSGDIPARRFERLNTRADRLKKGTEVLLTGFGCTKEGGSDGGYGVQFEGEANVEPVKDTTEPDGLPKETNQAWARHYITTSGGAAVCYGDSGGASYLYLDGAKQSRTVIGVNSRGNISKVSYISATSTGAFEAWISDWMGLWAKKMNVDRLEICGINATTISCHP